MDVIGFGAINLDEVYTVLGPSPLRDLGIMSGSEQIVCREEYERLTKAMEKARAHRSVSGGGQAANTMYALACLGFRTAVIGGVGADAEGDSLLAGLAPADTSHVVRGGRTARCVVILDERGERTILVRPASEAPAPDLVAAWSALGGARCLHLTSLTHSEGLKAQRRLVETIPNHVKLSFDPGELYCRLGAQALAPILERTYVLFLGEREAELLVGSSDAEGCEKLLSLGPSLVVCKRGAQGVDVFAADGQRSSVPAKKVAVIDPTGAGDVFAAGFLAGLLLGQDLQLCAALGTEAAAQSITGYGRSSYPGPELLQSMDLPTPAESRMKGSAPT